MTKTAVFSAALAAAGAVLSASAANAQLRIVTMNASNATASTAGPRSGMQTILQAIGSTVLDDPTVAGNTGIAKPIDVLCLQEVHSPNTTGAQYAQLLNTMYGTTTFAYGTQTGATTGSGTQGVIYNSATVQLIDEVAIGATSGNGMAREAIRHQFRPVGYSSAADFYIYNSHYKSSSGDTARRNVEATIIRADADALGQGKNIIYLGDFNVFNSSEAMYQKLLSAGNGQAFDPINKPGAWNDGSAFRNIHTQTPYDAAIGQPGFDGAGGMDSRFDFQLITGELNDGNGLAYIPNSYVAFGNNGSHQLGQPLNTGSGAPANVLTALSSILDHLPVGADYQLPARMGASVSGVPERVIVGANVPVNVTVQNTAPVLFINGADGLDYTVTGAGSVSGSAGASNLAALNPGNVHALSMDTATPGVASGTVNLNSTSEAVANGSLSAAVSTTVLAHATPSFDNVANVNVATIDFGVRGRNLGTATMGFAISNLVDASGFTANLDLDSIDGAGNTSTLTHNAVTFANLAAGTSQSFVTSLIDDTNGTYAAAYTLNFSDEDLPGAIARGPLTLFVTGIIATPGDADLNGIVNFDDYALTDSGFLSGGTNWGNGDFDRNGVVNFDDYALIDAAFLGQTPGAVGRAVHWLNDGGQGDVPPQIDVVAMHYQQFGAPYAASFIAAVPEPAGAVLLVALCVVPSRRRRL